MRRPLTYLEGIWLVLLNFTLFNYHWIMLIILVLLFPRWGVLADEIWVQRKYNKDKRRGVEEMEEDIQEAIKKGGK